MTSPLKMSLQSPTLPPRLDKVDQVYNTGNGRLIVDSQQPIHNSAMVLVHESGMAPPESSDEGAPIVARSETVREIPGQSSRDLENVLESTGPRHEFGELSRLPPVDTNRKTHTSNGHQIEFASSTIQSQSSTNNIIHTDNNITSQAFDQGAASSFVDQSYLPSGNLPTTRHAGLQLKPAQETNREQSLEFTIDSSSKANNQGHQPQHHSSNIGLAALSHPTPSTHEATAAEIALGIPSPYNLRPENRNQPAMANDMRTEYLMAQQSKQGETQSIIESLPEEKLMVDEENTSRTSETGLVCSQGRLTPLHDSSDDIMDHPRITMIGTPSTVSTAPSSDDASLGTDYKLDDSVLPHLLQTPGHERSPSWGGEGLLPGFPVQGPSSGRIWMQSSPGQAVGSQQAWGGIHGHQSQQRVASFRHEGDTSAGDAHSGRYPSRNDHGWPHRPPQHPPQHHPHQSFHLTGDQQMQYPPQQHHVMQKDTRQGQGYFESSHQQQFGAYQQGQGKGYNTDMHHGSHGNATPAVTPPRNARSQRQQGQSHRQTPPGTGGSSPHQSSLNPQRSASEILKTLLRKKACLYEPDTSRSVALVTWLVGRELALEYGFFSRQQLQSGVHACVADKIDSGTITRTKVNRCMQIILNSCFHYIIPRSDGSEEKGDSFRDAFARNVENDSFLLRHLPAPWNDLSVQRAVVIEAALNDGEEAFHQQTYKNPSTPKSSPKLSSVNADRSPGKDAPDGDNAESKRAVLLCFNENVRSAEDVFRCHNEFIRDTANAAHLQLTAQEWRTFFGREAARAPYLWGSVGVPISQGESQGDPSRQPDILGQMSLDEAGKFRTTWCTKRYDHDHDLCGFSHVEVNGGWLRRNPTTHNYGDEMCPYVSTTGDKRVTPGYFFLNECPKGVHCEKAHSMEEILYHPIRYKRKVCTALYSRSGACQLGDVCPDLHPPDSLRSFKKPSEGRSHSSRHSKKNEQANASAKAAFVPPSASPVIYASPAPISSFERQLAMPGLQNLFRRHSAVIRAHIRTSGKCRCCYSCFGDDFGVLNESPPAPKFRSGLAPTGRF